jgi:hypothetical protein
MLVLYELRSVACVVGLRVMLLGTQYMMTVEWNCVMVCRLHIDCGCA